MEQVVQNAFTLHSLTVQNILSLLGMWCSLEAFIPMGWIPAFPFLGASRSVEILLRFLEPLFYSSFSDYSHSSLVVRQRPDHVRDPASSGLSSLSHLLEDFHSLVAQGVFSQYYYC